MRNLLLVLHIVGVAIWLGANFVLAFVGPRVAGAAADTRIWWADTQGAMARILYNVAGVLIVVTGVWMLLLDDSRADFSSAFVSIGFVAVIIGAVLGMTVFGPGARRLADTVRSGDEAAERSLVSRLATFGLVDTAIIVVTIFAMVGRWGV